LPLDKVAGCGELVFMMLVSSVSFVLISLVVEDER
jgi:hypothetical protein